MGYGAQPEDHVVQFIFYFVFRVKKHSSITSAHFFLGGGLRINANATADYMGIVSGGSLIKC